MGGTQEALIELNPITFRLVIAVRVMKHVLNGFGATDTANMSNDVASSTSSSGGVSGPSGSGSGGAEDGVGLSSGKGKMAEMLHFKVSGRTLQDKKRVKKEKVRHAMVGSRGGHGNAESMEVERSIVSDMTASLDYEYNEIGEGLTPATELLLRVLTDTIDELLAYNYSTIVHQVYIYYNALPTCFSIH